MDTVSREKGFNLCWREIRRGENKTGAGGRFQWDDLRYINYIRV